ncbi:MAM domain-containing glycosylphosphatidylinositol anchor protein 2 isoform X2 [Phycodurus eques]|uniref:MAM domain-containing glycosylphosphatidylinositol anchor protein 2 isoform X2 n=1 Tax=Phycodurus eques TaxID=693459 RepID=UPI002ACE025B|nr:MAM domain-containing glycosylphosphatidylinositol anchor protein 2 isoform X2 [Phycodurus eques]
MTAGMGTGAPATRATENGGMDYMTLVCPHNECQPEVAPPTVRIVHSGPACDVEEERQSERVYTIREGETLELVCLVTGHPRPQVRWTKTAGGSWERQGDSRAHNDTLKIESIGRHQGGRYYCKADNGIGTPAIRSIRVDVYFLDEPLITVHQSAGDAKDRFYAERTVFLRCVAASNPPVAYTWRRGRQALSQGADAGVDIYEPFFTPGETKILKLKNLRPQDYANYTCVASVRNACDIADKMAHFSLSNRTAPPSVELLPDDPLVVDPGRTVTLVCVTSGGEPPPALRWVRPGGEALPEGSVTEAGTLTIPAVAVDDGGAYSCLADNNVGGGARKSTDILVRGLRKARFWITPDPYHDDDRIRIGREVKISCQVEATPPEELQFGWMKNGRPLRSSERMVITHTDAEMSPGVTNLDIIDLKFTDFGTYTCAASLRDGGSPEISIDVNISSTTVPPELTVPRGRSRIVAREGDTVELRCLVSGKPKPVILWSRAEDAPEAADEVPAGAPPATEDAAQTEGYDGILRLADVTREMGGTYRCRTSQYNGFNVKPRQALVQLAVQFPPAVEPAFSEVRQALGRAFALTCRLLRAHPARPLRYEWKLGSRLLTVGRFDEQSDDTRYQVRALNREGYGEYTCDISNDAGAGRCTFLVTGKAYPPEFYYDTRGALWQNRPRSYGFKLQWTQMEPAGVDRILAYRLGIRQVGQGRWWEQEIPVEAGIRKGELLTYNLTQLVKPESYLVRLTPITRYGEGDATERIIAYSAPVNPHLREFQCAFEDETLCLFSQDKSDDFDWTRHSAASRDTKYTPNTGPGADRRGSKQGHYVYIETSRPRMEGDQARLLSPTFNAGSKSGATYCLAFYYHMYGKHIGALNAFLRQKGAAASEASEASVWSLSGNQGDRWRRAAVDVHPSADFQVVLEGVRGAGIEGDIAVDDVTIQEGRCQDPPSNNLISHAPPRRPALWLLRVALSLTLIGRQRYLETATPLTPGDLPPPRTTVSLSNLMTAKKARARSRTRTHHTHENTHTHTHGDKLTLTHTNLNTQTKRHRRTCWRTQKHTHTHTHRSRRSPCGVLSVFVVSESVRHDTQVPSDRAGVCRRRGDWGRTSRRRERRG